MASPQTNDGCPVASLEYVLMHYITPKLVSVGVWREFIVEMMLDDAVKMRMKDSRIIGFINY
jgi:hypothetical protein